MNYIEDIVATVIETTARKVLIQVPEGLKTRVVDIVNELQKHKIDSVVVADPCYGSCDIILHIGHNKFYKNIGSENMDHVLVLYYPWKINVDIDYNAMLELSKIKEHRIALFSVIQHLHELDKIKDALESMVREVSVKGQILGCWPNPDVDEDAVLIITSGQFHARPFNKPVYIFNTETKKLVKLDMRSEKKRFANIEKAKDATIFGILISSKSGQFQNPDDIEKMLQAKGKKTVKIIMNEITQERLEGLKVDAFINTACPRIVEDVFHRPIINAEDVEKI